MPEHTSNHIELWIYYIAVKNGDLELARTEIPKEIGEQLHAKPNQVARWINNSSQPSRAELIGIARVISKWEPMNEDRLLLPPPITKLDKETHQERRAHG